MTPCLHFVFSFFFNDTATTEIYTLSLHDALPIYSELEIGHVLFMDVVGYSKLLNNEQLDIQRQLTEIARGTERFRAADTAGKLIRLPVGDGMALVFFDSPEAPVQCAMQIGHTLKAYPQFQLRMGIHSG